MAKMLLAGHASCDLPFQPVDKSVFDTDTIFARDAKVLTGGDALNTTVTLVKLGMENEARFISVVGEDVYGKITLSYLKEHGVCIKSIRIDPGVSSLVTVILIDSDHERHFVCYGNAARHITPEDIFHNIAADTRYLHIGSFMSLDALEGENAARLFQRAKELGIHTSFDVTFDNEGRWLKKIESALPFTDLMFASYDEAVCLSGGLREEKEIGAFFRSRGVKCFILKLGERGCYALDQENEFFLPAYENSSVVDTTGAGDAFVAGYLYALQKGCTVKECCVSGNAEGCMAVSGLGSHASTGGKKELSDFLRSNGALGLDAEALIEKLQ